MTSTKVAIVTGGNKGIGLATVRALCSKFKGDVVLTARNEERGLEAKKVIESEGLKVKFHQLDIDDEASITKLCADMKQEYGGIDVLVNNAGVKFENPNQGTFSSRVTATFKTNFFGMLSALKILLPIVKPGGRVVNLSSILGTKSLMECSPELQKEFRSNAITEEQLVKRMNEFIDFAHDGTLEKNGYSNFAYGMSKLSVTVLSHIYAKRLTDEGKNDILLNACCPGWTATDLTCPEATKTPDQGAETVVYLALLPDGAIEPHGQFVTDKKIQQW